ncbi:MAG TPA: YciI family protein [Jatrophihabitans sp.]|jgi:hypothetical protein
MRYLMLVCLESPDAPKAAPNTSTGMDVDDWVETMDARGARLLGWEIEAAKQATTVRVRGDEVLVTDGPFVETKEVIAGFDILDAPDLAAAVEIAAAHPMAYAGVLELRPFANYP